MFLLLSGCATAVDPDNPTTEEVVEEAALQAPLLIFDAIFMGVIF